MICSDRALACSLANLADGAASIIADQEKRIGYLGELADAAIEGFVTAGEATSVRSLLALLSSTLDALPTENFASGLGAWRNRPLLDAVAAELSEGDRALLARILLDRCKVLFDRAPTLADFRDGAVPPPLRSRTVYVRNPLTDRAYPLLCEALDTPTVGYRTGFRELLDDVEHGYADYAVLPLFSGGARIGSVFSLLEDYSLHVAAVAVVDGGEEEVTFGLVSREAVALGTPNRFLFSLALGEGELAGMLTAMRRLGVTPHRFEATPLAYEDGRLSLRATVGGSEGALVDFLTYLSLFWPGYAGYGFYTELE